MGGVVTASLGSAGMPGLFGLLVVAAAWLLRRRRGSARMLAEGCCPACLAAGALAAARLRAETQVAPS